MAGTYRPLDALNQAQKFVHNIPIDSIKARVADEVNSFIWLRWPWSWTQSALTAISCVDSTQDYTISNTDFMRLINARLVRTDSTPDEFRELRIVDFLSPELTRKGGIDSIRSIAYEHVTQKLRLDKAVSVPSGVTIQIQGEYQKKPTKITDSNLTTVLDQPDHYFGVFYAGVLWKLYQASDDERAAGQFVIFRDALQQMLAAEDFADSNHGLFPDSPLGMGRDAGYGIYGSS